MPQESGSGKPESLLKPIRKSNLFEKVCYLYIPSTRSLFCQIHTDPNFFPPRDNLTRLVYALKSFTGYTAVTYMGERSNGRVQKFLLSPPQFLHRIKFMSNKDQTIMNYLVHGQHIRVHMYKEANETCRCCLDWFIYCVRRHGGLTRHGSQGKCTSWRWNCALYCPVFGRTFMLTQFFHNEKQFCVSFFFFFTTN